MIDTLLLSRIQFALTVTFHILFPAFSIGIATFLVVMEGLWLKTQNKLYLSICKYWTKIFALTFGMGVVSGIVMEFQLGTNWSHYTQAVGPVLGSLFTYEVLTAFFIEAGFLGVMIFGWDRVGHKLHYASTILVVLGVSLSAFWILSANSWMQFPTGAHLEDGVFVVDSYIKVIFNPLVWPRFIHMLLSAYITTGFVIMGVSAYYILKNQHTEFAKKCMSLTLFALLILVPTQIFVGDVTGIKVKDYQPIKTAAMEGLWETTEGAPLLLFAIPDQKNQTNKFELGIPKLASFINTHDWNGKLLGLNTVDVKDQPYVPMVFYSFRVMVGIGFAMLGIILIAAYKYFRQTLYTSSRFLKLCVLFSPAGFIAILTGWFTAEIGRQPWVVQNYLRIADSVSTISLHNVMISFVLIVIVYGIIFGLFYFKYLAKIIKTGPSDHLTLETPPFAYMESQLAEEK